MNRNLFLAVSICAATVFAHGGGDHLKGVIEQASTSQLTIMLEDKQQVVVALDKDTRFEIDGKTIDAKALAAGSRVVVHLKPKSKVAALVKVAGTAIRLDVTVTNDGFIVADPKTLKAGQPVTLVVTRKTEQTCATDIVLKDFGIKQALPLDKPVEVSFTPTKAGTVRFACAMDMITGTLKVE